MADILNQIDAALADVTDCFCGCKRAIRASGPSLWFFEEDCQVRWNGQRIKSGIEEEAVEPEAVVEVPARQPFTLPAEDYEALYGRPARPFLGAALESEMDAFEANLLAALDELVEPNPDEAEHVCILAGCNQAVRHDHLQPLDEPSPTFTVIDETHTFARHYLNERVEAIRQAERRAHPARLVRIATEDEFACEMGEDGQCDNDCIGPPAPHIDAALEPDEVDCCGNRADLIFGYVGICTLPAGHEDSHADDNGSVWTERRAPEPDMSECRNVPNIPTRPWWSRLLRRSR